MKEVTWQHYILHKKLQAVCCMDPKNPHLVKFDRILLAGSEKGLPFVFCPKHQGYFGVSADVDMDKMIIRLKEKKGGG